MEKRKIEVKGVQISIEADFISLTDIARHGENDPTESIRSWLKSRSTLLFLEAWETLHNPDFKVYQMAHFVHAAISNRAIVSAQRFVEMTGAVGLRSKSGRYGGTWAHKDIALEFLTWLDPTFKVYFIKEFQRLKDEEAKRLSSAWEAQRVKDLLDEARLWMDSILPPDASAKSLLDAPTEPV